MTDLIQLGRNAANGDVEKSVVRRARRRVSSLLSESRRMRRRLRLRTSRRANARQNRSTPPSHDYWRKDRKSSGHCKKLIYY